MQLELTTTGNSRRTISPFRELGAYEALWQYSGTTFKSIAEKFAKYPGSVPSDFVSDSDAGRNAETVYEKLTASNIGRFGIRVHGVAEYPGKLRDATHPVELLYFAGWWDLANSPSIAVIGTRQPSNDGQARTRRLVRALVDDDFTIVSGLATGIDTSAHITALECGGRTVAVIGTPLSHCYPKDNIDLQRTIAENFLVISQVPVLQYENQDHRYNRRFFPERNKTMSALTEATVIVEAGETSGTLIQAQAALEQGRKLFILDSCFNNPFLTWPTKYAKEGAIRVRDYDDIQNALFS